MKINWMEINLWIKKLLGLRCKVFATYYVAGEWEDILRVLDDLHISNGETIPSEELDLMDLKDNEDEVEHIAFFPDNGKVTINSLGNSGFTYHWSITFEACSEWLEKMNYWMSPSTIECQTWDTTFTKQLHGEAAEWGIR